MNKKEEALQRMEIMGLSPTAKNLFKKNDRVLISERLNSFFDGILSVTENYPDVINKIREFEKERDALVYYVQLSHMEFGECYSFFYVSNYEDEWKMDRENLEEGRPIVYVWNKTYEELSEFGSIGIITKDGVTLRTY